MHKALAISAILIILGTAYRADACSCAQPQPVGEALNQAASVFSGRVVAIVPAEGGTFRPVSVTFAVDRIWKGSRAAQTHVLTTVDGASCGYGFKLGESYLVYTYADQKKNLWTSICSRTKPVCHAGEDLKVLGEGVKPEGDTDELVDTSVRCLCDPGEIYSIGAKKCVRSAPGFCPSVYEPVCGCDGRTYSNGCYAASSGVISWTQGACR